MSTLSPWGHIDWLLPKLKNVTWKGVFCPSFEPRSVAVPSWLATSHYGLPHYGIKIIDPPNRFSSQIDKITNQHETEIKQLLGSKYESTSENLLTELSSWNMLVNQLSADPDSSILMDITSMPKRMFLFMVKRFLASPNIKDLVVCYTCADGHKEGKLTENSSPPSALPGFARETENEGNASVIVSVGYMAFNFAEFLEEYSATTSTKFLFPFPPGSPSFRRNWRRLHDLLPAMENQAEIKRTHAMDMFAALEWLKNLDCSVKGNIDLIPLGPKPHALAMGLAHQKLGGRAEIIYSQPQIYHPEYSHGIAKNAEGKPEIYAYCLRRNRVKYV